MRFTRSRSGVVTAELSDVEAAVLASAVAQLVHLLGAQDPVDDDPLAAMVGLPAGDVRRPDDPALARLLPDASRDDDEVAAEFRRLTERGLRERKQGALATAAATLERLGPPGRGEALADRLGRPASLVLDDAEAAAWLTALNDVRLVVAERLGLRTDDDAERIAAAGASVEGREGVAAFLDRRRPQFVS